ncbi:bifunctional tetrahydrofolate synthase/dihydrofolate synthase [Pseudomonas mangrovi]|uniref:Dihydrofolate synthase/folylpolyglutamate synthase n=1 Tax=Pseudomonas mangrovi TaxID=2161748 RepID=A0A2T5P4P1_9PSED|nr:bifunctional tetrahydrofolate synthase/dihydrofolate synthase [Pseudomonas mangrovi]PTU72698.1 bifunctional tetrahydrofolate synthase/dihydrofolate synthase [Pseudomonas mangrovi]
MTQRSLADWLAYLEQLHPSAIDMGLERVAEVAARLGLGRPAKRVVTVTGTNGKGSTCAFLAALLAGRGHKVGIYSSPHLLQYNERVVIDGQMVADDALCRAFSAVEAARGDTSLTYFEMGTLAALWLFEQAELGVAVLEVGLGGRLDAVNLIDADLALITSIGVDHAEWLGDSRESVAREKAGIMRAGRAALCGDPQPPANLLQYANTLGVELSIRGRDFDLAVEGSGWRWSGRSAQGDSLTLDELPLLDLPMENAALALQAFVLLEPQWRIEQVRRALGDTRLVGRLDRRQVQVNGRTLTLLLDVGHNPQASEFLAGRLRQRACAGRRHAGRRYAVFGLLADKDLPGVVQPLLDLVDTWAVAPLPCGRSRAAAELREVLSGFGARSVEAGSVAEALDKQCAQADEQDEILVFGSFYCVAEALAWLARH